METPALIIQKTKQNKTKQDKKKNNTQSFILGERRV